MYVWLIAIAVLGFMGATGYFKGAIRSSVSLLGLFVALFASMPLAGPVRPLIPKLGLPHPFWGWFLPPAIVFLLIALVFMGLSFLVHHKVAMHFKYGADDYTRARWERLNSRLGLGVGLVGGCIYTILIGLAIYILGYPAVQVSTENSSGEIRFLADARQQLKDAGLDKSLAAIDPMPDYYYLTSDVIGLLYHNHILQDRLAAYPGFLLTSQRPELQEIATDVDLQGQWQTKASFIGILKNPKIVAIMGNQEIAAELKQLDLKDLYQYLRIGKSAKYDDERILGRWRLDPAASLIQYKKKNPDLSAREMNFTKKVLTLLFPKVTLLATPDNKAILKMDLTEDAKRAIQAEQQANQPPPDANQPGAEEAQAAAAAQAMMMRRYGRTGGAPAAPATQAARPAEAKKGPTLADVNIATQGSWSREGLKYKLNLANEKDKFSGEATADEDRLIVSLSGYQLVFNR